MTNRIARLVAVAAGCAGVLLGSLAPAVAIPAFARKYGFECTMCHSNFPRLNDFGVRYRQNAYQLPGRENEEKTVLESPPPFAMRTSGGYNLDKFKNTEDAEDICQFQINGLDILSGGSLGRDIGYFFIFPPKIEGSQGVVEQPGTVEMANVTFSTLGSTWLNVRAGRFEPACTAFSVKRQLSASPYEIYDFAFPGGPAFAETQTGIEVTGQGRNGCSYAAGWIDGSGTNNSDDAPSDVYIRAAKVFGRGEGQTVGHKVGLTAYFGKARPDSSLPATSRKDFNRFAIDASLNCKQWNIAAQYLTGNDDKALWGTGSDVDFSGGFVEVSCLPATNFVGFARFDVVDTPSALNQDITRWTIGGRYYIQDNLAVHTEFSHRNQDSGTPEVGDATENYFTTRLDWAF